ncbi:MAG: hypothetical protein HZA58_02640 [Acidimicrobiia bacterium]|nr:hypothetical protein [Acidimicrobiia bacterium]
MTTPEDEAPLTSDEMLRRAREGLGRPIELPTAAAEASSTAPSAPGAPRPPRPVARAPRLHRPPPITRPNPAQTRVVIAVAIVIALIGAGVALLAAMAASTP